jgi:hypothetical protein
MTGCGTISGGDDTLNLPQLSCTGQVSNAVVAVASD